MSEPVRLQRFLSQAGVAARRKAEELIVEGRVTVNGKVVRELGTKVDPLGDRVSVDGEAIVAEEHFYLVFNKPKGCITAVRDDRDRPTVMDYLPNLPASVAPVGRLDFYSEGVLLLTNDGELAAKLLSPKSHVPKTYHVKVWGSVSAKQLQILRDGVRLEDGTETQPAVIEELPAEGKHPWLQITLHEGKSRQIHRMLEALGHSVQKIQRVSFGNLTFHGLRVGDARELNQREVNDLRELVGLDRSAVSRGRWQAKREDTDVTRRAMEKARAEREAVNRGLPVPVAEIPEYDREIYEEVHPPRLARPPRAEDRARRGPRKDARQPSRSEERRPSRTDARGPSRTTEDRRPSRTDARPPSRTDDRRPSRTDDRRPSRTDDRRPSRTDDRRPSRTDDRLPSRTDDRRPSRTDARRPSRTEDRRPSRTDARPPSRTIEDRRPSRTTEDRRPSRTDARPPSRTEDRRPSRTTEDRRPSRTTEDRRPSRTTEDRRPSRTTEDRRPSRTTEDRRPSRTTEDRRPSRTTEDRRPSRTTEDRRPSRSAAPVADARPTASRSAAPAADAPPRPTAPRSTGAGRTASKPKRPGTKPLRPGTRPTTSSARSKRPGSRPRTR